MQPMLWHVWDQPDLIHCQQKWMGPTSDSLHKTMGGALATHPPPHLLQTIPWKNMNGALTWRIFVFKGALCLFIIFVDRHWVVLRPHRILMTEELHPHFLLGQIKTALNLHHLQQASF